MSEIKNIPRLRFPEFQEDWKILPLGDLCKQISYGLTVRPKYYESGIPLISAREIVSGKIDFDGAPKISEEDFLQLSNKAKPKFGDVFLSKTGTIGLSTIFLENFKIAITQNISVLRFKDNQKNSPFFLLHYLRTRKFIKTAIKKVNQSTIMDLQLGDIKKINFPFPTIVEQQKIADFLTGVDKRIELLEKKKTLLETYKKGVMKKIFNQEIRFKDDKGNDFPDWEEKKVKDVFRVTRGNVLSVNQMTESENLDYRYPVYSSQTKNKGVVGYYNEFLFQDSLTWTTDGANAGEVNFRKGKFYCTNVCGVLISENGFANECISNLINSVSKRYVSYVGNPKLMNGVMAEIKLAFPSIKEQEKISKFLVSVDIKIDLLETQIDKSKTWKKGLLQKMFV